MTAPFGPMQGGATTIWAEIGSVPGGGSPVGEMMDHFGRFGSAGPRWHRGLLGPARSGAAARRLGQRIVYVEQPGRRHLHWDRGWSALGQSG